MIPEERARHMGKTYQPDKEELKEAMADSNSLTGVRKMYELLYKAQTEWLNDIIEVCSKRSDRGNHDLAVLSRALRDILSISFPKPETNGEFIIDELQREISKIVTEFRNMTQEITDEAEGQEQQKG